MNRLGPEYNKLSSLLDPSKSIEHAEVLNSLKKRLRAETYTQDYIKEVLTTEETLFVNYTVNLLMFITLDLPWKRHYPTKDYPKLPRLDLKKNLSNC